MSTSLVCLVERNTLCKSLVCNKKSSEHTVEERLDSLAGSRTPLSRVTGGCTSRYTTEDMLSKHVCYIRLLLQTTIMKSGRGLHCSVFSKMVKSACFVRLQKIKQQDVRRCPWEYERLSWFPVRRAFDRSAWKDSDAIVLVGIL